MSELDISRATRTRFFLCARKLLGIGLTYDRIRDTYRVTTWGVINPKALDKYGRKKQARC